MRKLILAYLIVLSAFTYGQSSWNTATRAGYNRIGLGFDQSVGLDFGENKNNTLALGIRWYSIDVVFEKETIGPVLAYKYNFPSHGKLQLSLGFSTGYFFEKKDKISKKNVLDNNLFLRSYIVNWPAFQPFLELGYGMIFDHTSSTSLSVTNLYSTYQIGIGFEYKFLREG